MDTAEYLEKLASEAFKRELDRDENVVRSISLFGAMLGLAASLFSYATPLMPPLSGAPYSLTLYGLLLVGAAALAAGVVWLVIAIRARRFIFPPKETELIDYARKLRDWQLGQGLAPGEADAKVVEDLRNRMADEFARAAVHNRANNLERAKARTYGVTLAAIALVMALAMVTTTFVGARTGIAPKETAKPADAKAAANPGRKP